jgi:hypothetical protein
MGLSWADIISGLKDQRVLPPDHARHLLAELDARPFTRSMLFGEHFNKRDSLFVASMRERCPDGTWPSAPPPPSVIEHDIAEEELERAYRGYVTRRQELMDLLRVAIERLMAEARA